MIIRIKNKHYRIIGLNDVSGELLLRCISDDTILSIKL
jgi:hypothetical protein